MVELEGLKKTTATKYDFIYQVVKHIPRGCVATYGQIALLAGIRGQARLVGYVLASLPETEDVPWHRVINSRGAISKRLEPHEEKLQRILLESEGVIFNTNNRVSLSRFLWHPGYKFVSSSRAE